MAVIDRMVPGMAEAMRAAGLAKTPHAMLSRGVCGLRGQTLIVNLSGSPRAVREQLESVLPALPHAVQMTAGIPQDCAR
jgi:molybdopterin biosynthesis enzyme MoaB